MRKGCRLGAGVLACALLAAAPSTASALVVHARNGHFFGIQLHRGIKASSVPGSIAAQQSQAAQARDNGTLTYHNGPVVHSSAPYLIFWAPSGESIPGSSQSLMERYFTDVATDSKQQDDVYGVTRQYTDGTGFAGAGQTFNAATQAVVDTQPYPPNDATNCPYTTSSYPTCITDAQIQQELGRFIASAGLPTDGPSSATELPQSAPIYFVVLPADVNICNPGVGCASSTFCAYHGSAPDGSDLLLYAAMPMLLAETQPKSCQSDGNNAVQEPNSDAADVVIGDLSHEDNETISDPTAQGWYDPTSGNEEADGCSATGPFSPAAETHPNAFLPTLGGSATAGTLYDQLINSDQYYTQSEWSNGDAASGGTTKACRMQPAAGTITASFTEPSGPNAAGTSLTFNPSASTSTNAISSETWDFGDGSPQTFHLGGLTSVSHAYSAAGTYTVKLTLVDNRGNVQSTTQQITIVSGPTASFTFSPTTPLEGTSVSFDGSSSTPDPGTTITSYAWKFGDGTTGSGATAAHSYPSPATYTVTLTVTDSDGLTSMISHTITVADERPTASFTISPGPYGVGQTVAVDGSASSDPDGTITSYAWKFGDGSTGSGATATHAYTATGTYTITLTLVDSSGQTATSSQQLTVYTPPTASFSFSPVAPVSAAPVSFDGSGSSDPDTGVTITSYAWNFGDGSTGSGRTTSHTYAADGPYTVTLTVTNSVGLTSSVSHQITVDENPTAGFTISPGPYGVGRALTVDGSASSDPDGTIKSYAWNFGDGTTGSGATATHAYAPTGTYTTTYTITLTVLDSNGRTSTSAPQQVTVHTPPTASFSFSPAAPVPGALVSFNGNGSDPDPGDTITSYAWNFGDGSTGSGATTSHTYATDGPDAVSLTVTDSVGLSTTISHSIPVDENPTAGLTISQGPYGVGRAITVGGSGSIDPDGTISSYAWSFGDGTTGSGATASHVFAASGTYTISLTVLDSGGRTNTTSQTITVHSLPVPSLGFSPPAPLTGTAVGFTASGSSDADPGVAITSYAWNFGDGSTASGATASHTYAMPGNYTVALTLTNSVGLTASRSVEVTVFPPPPTASFAVITRHPAARVPVRFNASSSSAPQESITAYVWSFGDGSTGHGVAPAHTYRKAGTYRVTLTVLTSFGLSATSEDTLVVVKGSRITKVAVSGKGGSKLLAITINGRGTLWVGSRRIVAARAKTVKVRIAPPGSRFRMPSAGRPMKITVPITFAPQIGARTTRRVTVTFTA